MSRSGRWRQSPRRRKIAAGHVVYFHAFSHFAHPFRRNGRPFHSFTSLAYNCSCPPPQKKALPSHTRWCKMILWVCFTLGNIFGFRAESRSEGTRDPLLFAPGARALTPDQQDGVGEKPLLLLQKNLFFQTLCRQAGKTALYPECLAAKKLRTTLALPLKSLLAQKKSPPGWASSTNRCRKLWSCLTAQRGGNAAALPGKAGVNQPTNGRSVLAGASVRMARTSGTRSGYCRRIARISSFVIMPKRSFLLYL